LNGLEDREDAFNEVLVEDELAQPELLVLFQNLIVDLGHYLDLA